MDERTRLKLEFLGNWYAQVRSYTLRLLGRLADDELEWKPVPGVPSVADLVLGVAAQEERSVQRRLIGASVLPNGVKLRPHRPGSPRRSQRELEVVLKKLRRRSLGFLRDLVFGRRGALAPDVVRQIEGLIVRELRVQGQIELLRQLKCART